jgi:hypothetical protein
MGIRSGSQSPVSGKNAGEVGRVRPTEEGNVSPQEPTQFRRMLTLLGGSMLFARSMIGSGIFVVSADFGGLAASTSTCAKLGDGCRHPYTVGRSLP